MSTSKLNLGVVAFLACLLLALPAAAKVDVGGVSVTFDVENRTQGYALTVSGPDGYRHVQEFEPGAQMSWSATGVADGLYKYELIGLAEHRERGKDAPGLDSAAGAISGALTVKDGTLLNPDRPEKITKDVVHLDDTIIDGSACVGFDCVNGENFGFDTLRLKENNLRIHFDDTSSTGSFPANDWRIVANDSSSGGSNYLAIEDSTAGRIPFRVEAGARANALVVEADGDVGIGTLNPAVDLEVVTGNTPTLRLQQDGSSGFTPQTWDVAGNEANFFVRDVTNGSKLSFRIRPGAPESSIDIQSDGDVGIGTSSPGSSAAVSDVQLEVTGLILSTGSLSGLQVETRSGGIEWTLAAVNDSSGLIFDESGVGTALTVLNGGGIDVAGPIRQNAVAIHPDYVFESEYELESIEDHADYMWSNKHLPAVGPGEYDEEGRAVIEYGQKTFGILEELEKAHLYIEQLHKRLARLEASMEEAEAEE